MTSRAYGTYLRQVFGYQFDASSVTYKAMLCTASYTPDFDNHEVRSDVTNQVTGTGYSAGGIVLTGIALTYDTTNHWLSLDADDADFGTLTVSGIAKLVTYVDLGGSGVDILVSCHDFTPESPAAQNFTYEWDTGHIGTFNY